LRKILLLLFGLIALAHPAGAFAHPLGNFTINRYSRIERSGDRIYVLYVLDMAEIPTYQAKSTVRAKGAEAYADGLAASIGRRLEQRTETMPASTASSAWAWSSAPSAFGSAPTLRIRSSAC
jgi:nickel/cobalt transporter (NicO) family protein